jgi:hypothetical protein
VTVHEQGFARGRAVLKRYDPGMVSDELSRLALDRARPVRTTFRLNTASGPAEDVRAMLAIACAIATDGGGVLYSIPELPPGASDPRPDVRVDLAPRATPKPRTPSPKPTPPATRATTTRATTKRR